VFVDFLRIFSEKVFDMEEKRTKKKSQEKNVLGLVGSSKVNQTYVEVRQIVFECPSALALALAPFWPLTRPPTDRPPPPRGSPISFFSRPLVGCRSRGALCLAGLADNPTDVDVDVLFVVYDL
jgi:hypothetical protein